MASFNFFGVKIYTPISAKGLSAMLHDVRCPHDDDVCSLNHWSVKGVGWWGGVTGYCTGQKAGLQKKKKDIEDINGSTVAQRMPLFTTRFKVQYKCHYKSVQNVKHMQ